ncbi:MAG TPA: hypothetical protein VMQ93_08400 [Novosphingobium sp.]|nr:hypothetical protein [Novosphingobium sp.]
MPFSRKDRQTTSTVVRLGKSFSAEVRTDFSPAGFVGVGIMVSTMMLGSAVIVAAARWRRRKVPVRQIEG